jgi:hypothetical protein
MSNLAVVAKPGQEPTRVYPAPGLATAIVPNSPDDARQQPPGKELAKPVVSGSPTDPV